VVGDNRSKKEFAASSASGQRNSSGAAKVARELVVNAGRTLRVKNTAELGRANGFRDHDPAE